jgi:hypothetical protein
LLQYGAILSTRKHLEFILGGTFGLAEGRGVGDNEGRMSRYEIPFLTACIQAFGRRFAMSRQAAFRYLRDHKGLAFLIEFYDVEHLQSIEETIDDLLIICRQNGGTLGGEGSGGE